MYIPFQCVFYCLANVEQSTFIAGTLAVVWCQVCAALLVYYAVLGPLHGCV